MFVAAERADHKAQPDDRQQSGAECASGDGSPGSHGACPSGGCAGRCAGPAGRPSIAGQRQQRERQRDHVGVKVGVREGEERELVDRVRDHPRRVPVPVVGDVESLPARDRERPPSARTIPVDRAGCSRSCWCARELAGSTGSLPLPRFPMTPTKKTRRPAAASRCACRRKAPAPPASAVAASSARLKATANAPSRSGRRAWARPCCRRRSARCRSGGSACRRSPSRSSSS